MENENQVNEQAEQKKFCKHCGKQINATATFCTHCGKSQTATAPKAQAQQPAQPVVQVEQKSKLVAGLLAIFLGTLGIHNFYLGYTQKAVLQLVISLVGSVLTVGIATTAVAVWSIVEAIMLFAGSIKVDGKGVPLKD